ncbi:MAG: hypothetical protein HN348_03140 [Proteobacteria bacterium]|jgi:hypothetical protein|nr:hypothetical protein [Pseudomonadota bacterium]
MRLFAFLLVGCVPQWPEGLLQDPNHDFDGDGFNENQGDCDDNKVAATPEGTELCSDDIDNDCVGGKIGCPTDISSYVCQPGIFAKTYGNNSFPVVSLGKSNNRTQILLGGDEADKVFVLEVSENGDCDARFELTATDGSGMGTAIIEAPGILAENTAVAIGGPAENSLSLAGEVGLYYKEDLQLNGALNPQITLTDDTPTTNFGYSMAIRTTQGSPQQLAIAAPAFDSLSQTPKVYLFNGALEQETDISEAKAVLVGEPASKFGGYTMASDITGDGDTDLMIVESHPKTRVHILTNSGLDGVVEASYESDYSLTTTADIHNFSRDVSMTAGDFDGDGQTDLLFAAMQTNEPCGQIWLIPGGEALQSGDMSVLAVATIDGPDQESEVISSRMIIAAAGDANEDGFADFVLGAAAAGVGNHGEAYLATGPFEGQHYLEFRATPYYDSDPDKYSFGRWVGSVDAMGDSTPELVIAGMDRLFFLPTPLPW